MFVGHFGAAFAAKRAAPRVSLGTLFLAFQFADLLWPVLLIAGVEHVRGAPGLMPTNPYDFYDYPISHSLATLCLWGAIFGGAHWARRRDGRAALLLFGGVVSHWFLDALMHRPDVPLFPKGPYLGLGLWRSVPLTIAIEGALYVTGIALYHFSRDVVSMFTTYLAAGNNPDQPGRFIQWLYQLKPVKTFQIRGTWFDIGSKETLEEANRIFAAL